MQIPENAPFNNEQRTGLNSFLAGLSPEQQTYLCGFFAGASVTSGMPIGASATPSASAELTILYGTESGNSEELADRTIKLAKKNGFKAKAINMADTDTAKVSKAKNLLVIISTWGDGDPPDGATTFHTEIMGDGAAKFADTHFSVCALGDTSYEQFCETGKQIDTRLQELGAKRIYDRQDCDVDYEDDWAKWADAALKAFPVKTTASAPVASAAGLSAIAGGVAYSKKNPYNAEITEKILLNGTGSAKEILHLELSLEGSGLNYEVGDALAIIPENRDKDVQLVLDASGLSANTEFNGKTLAETLKKDFDITSLTSRIAGKYNKLANNDQLELLISPEKKADFASWAYGRQFVDLLEEFPTKGLTAESLTSLLRKMAPRLYSIASSPKAHEGEVHLTIAAVRYDAHEKDRVGVASTYVADLVESGDKVPVYVHSNKNFRIPADPNTSMIMIGPGTGVAPFRAFVEERQETGAKGKNWLVFGDQHYSYDFLYQLEWQDFLKEGVLDRLDVAFSRDQPHKVYVQDRLRENAAEIYRWIDEGGHVYVCGDAEYMAKDVHTALIEIIAEHGKKSTEDAEAFLADLKKQKRYQRDVY